MGEVWAGKRLADGGAVAIKLLLSSTANIGEVVARFKREAQVLARVQSEYAARVLDFLTDPVIGLVLVMDLIPGESLHVVLHTRERLSIEETLDIGVDIARGLRDLHAANVVHRDLKPGNVVLRPRPGQRPRATLIDFGVSRIISSSDEEEVTAITRGDRVLGTLEYMAPEQILGSRTVTGTADLYALGAILYRAIAGHHVYPNLTEGQLAVAKLNQDAPPLPTGGRDDYVAKRTAQVIARLLSRRLRERYQNADQVVADLEELRSMARSQEPRSRPESRVDVGVVEFATADIAAFELDPSLSQAELAPTSNSAPISNPISSRGTSQPVTASAAQSSARTRAAEPAHSHVSQSPTPTSTSAHELQQMASQPPRSRGLSVALITGALTAAAFAAGVFTGASYASGGTAYSAMSAVAGMVGSDLAPPAAASASAECPAPPEASCAPPVASQPEEPTVVDVPPAASASALPSESDVPSEPMPADPEVRVDEKPEPAPAAPNVPVSKPAPKPAQPKEATASAPTKAEAPQAAAPATEPTTTAGANTAELPKPSTEGAPKAAAPATPAKTTEPAPSPPPTAVVPETP